MKLLTSFSSFLALWGDNASNVDRMIMELEGLVDSFRRPRNRVRCLLHILNLVARVILAQFGDDTNKDLEGALTGLMDELEVDDDNDRDAASEGDSEESEVVEKEDEDEMGDDNEGEDLDDLVTADEISAMLADRDDLQVGLKPVKQLQKKVSTTHQLYSPVPDPSSSSFASCPTPS